MKSATRKFSIATSWDPGLLQGLAALGVEHAVRFEEVFGSFRQGLVGSARQAYRLPAVSIEDIAGHIRDAEDVGIGYVHLLNAPEISGRIADRHWRARLAKHLEELHGIGVRSLTIANEDLLRFVLESFRAQFRIKLSLIAGVDTVDRAREVEDLGVDVITLSPFSVNRDFERLGAIRASVACELELYANIPCLHECPLWGRHYRYLGLTTLIGRPSEPEPDPYLQYCSRVFLEDPVQLVKSPFIRPEDVEQYFAIGIDRLKLSDRAEPTAFLLRTAAAYASGRFSGNLFELVFRSGSKFRAALGPGSLMAHEPVPIIIDNDKLTSLDFLERIRSTRGCALESFYLEAAARAVTLESAAAGRWTSALRQASARSRGIPASTLGRIATP